MSDYGKLLEFTQLAKQCPEGESHLLPIAADAILREVETGQAAVIEACEPLTKWQLIKASLDMIEGQVHEIRYSLRGETTERKQCQECNDYMDLLTKIKRKCEEWTDPYSPTTSADAVSSAMQMLRHVVPPDEPDPHAEYEKSRAIEITKPCEHDPDRQVSMGDTIWCLHCGAIRGNAYEWAEWRLPERGR